MLLEKAGAAPHSGDDVNTGLTLDELPPPTRQRADAPQVVVIGGGISGTATAYDLAVRGIRVLLLERGEFGSGTSGRHHGLLHSGARYVHDMPAARECITENTLLRRIMPGFFEENGGYFVAFSEEDLSYEETFVRGCEEAGIPITEVTHGDMLAREPHLNPAVLKTYSVPDATMEAHRFLLRFLASALYHGAEARPYSEVVGLLNRGGRVQGVQVHELTTGREYPVEADLVLNATGPFAAKLIPGAPVRPTGGVMVAFRERWLRSPVNRLHRAGDGDIFLPQRELTIIGTTSYNAEADPDCTTVPQDQVRRMIEDAKRFVPEVSRATVRASWAAARPIFHQEGVDERSLSRDYRVIENQEGLLSIMGGKATTARAMAEAFVNQAMKKLGLEPTCRTRELLTLPHNAYYSLQRERRGAFDALSV